MSDELLDATSTQNERPTFLTVLIILTWVGSGLGVILNLLNIGQPYIPSWYPLLLVVLSAVTGYAAWQMWNLNKQGLMIYTVAEGIAAILPIVLVYGILGGNSFIASAMAGTVALGLIFPIAFIVMYWVNAKHLK